jgi:hydrogenase expression/formation protein HypC
MIMCLGVPGRIVKLEGKDAIAEIMGAERSISIELLENVKIGDYVLIHAGCAIQVVDEEEALDTIRLFNELRDVINA